jgi:hypothetical protein
MSRTTPYQFELVFKKLEKHQRRRIMAPLAIHYFSESSVQHLLLARSACVRTDNGV